MRTTAALCAVIVLLTVTSGAAFGVSYTGSVSYTPPWPADLTDGVYVGPETLRWANYNIDLSWVVSDTGASPSHPWHYSYTFTIGGTQGALSHLTIETSDNFTEADIINLTGASIDSIALQKVGPGNFGMPSDMYGIKFDPLDDDTFVMTWSFDSSRTPVWGDFYAKDGGQADEKDYAYNQGSTADDPTDPPADGSITFHILRPDTVVPEPLTLVLVPLGAIAAMVRMKWRQHRVAFPP